MPMPSPGLPLCNALDFISVFFFFSYAKDWKAFALCLHYHSKWLFFWCLLGPNVLYFILCYVVLKLFIRYKFSTGNFLASLQLTFFNTITWRTFRVTMAFLCTFLHHLYTQTTWSRRHSIRIIFYLFAVCVGVCMSCYRCFGIFQRAGVKQFLIIT